MPAKGLKDNTLGNRVPSALSLKPGDQPQISYC